MNYLKILCLSFAIFHFQNCFCQETKDLGGLWYSNSYTIDYSQRDIYPDADFEVVVSPISLYFDQDSVWTFLYPCQKLYTHPFNKKDWSFMNEVLSDKSGRTYQRADYDLALINRLKSEKFIPECLKGEWNLVRTESPGDGTGIKYIFPFEIEDSFFLDKQAINSVDLNENRITLPLGGQQREFYFNFSENYNYKLSLSPTENWKKKDKKMWLESWDTPELSKRKLKILKRSKGSDLELIYLKKN